jgi:hypothetical protein
MHVDIDVDIDIDMQRDTKDNSHKVKYGNKSGAERRGKGANDNRHKLTVLSLLCLV